MVSAFNDCGYCVTMANLNLPGHLTEVMMETRHMWCTDDRWTDYVREALRREPHDWPGVWSMREWIHNMHANYHRRSATACPWNDRLLTYEAMVWAGTPKSVRTRVLYRLEQLITD